MKYWRTPLDVDELKVPRGVVHILAERCKGCGFCIEYCPKDVLAFSDDFNRKGYHYPVLVGNGDCVNCNLCEIICPDFAIFSEAAPSAGADAAASDGNGAKAVQGEET